MADESGRPKSMTSGKPEKLSKIYWKLHDHYFWEKRKCSKKMIRWLGREGLIYMYPQR